jgi:hypothetical protein
MRDAEGIELRLGDCVAFGDGRTGQVEGCDQMAGRVFLVLDNEEKESTTATRRALSVIG